MASKQKLQDGEHVIHETGLHWIALLKEILYALALIASIILTRWVFGWSSGWLFLALLLGWAVVSFRGVSNWVTTKVVLTNQRIIFRQGLLSKKGYEIPVEAIQDVAFQQKALQGMVGAGDLLVKTAASSGSTAIRNLPDPQMLKEILGKSREDRFKQRQPPTQSLPPPGKTRAEQLEILGGLYEQGKLTEAEFTAEKSRLLRED